MRDSLRITPILATLEETWRKCPDLRLGQIMVNLLKPGEQAAASTCLFFMEDEEFLQRLRDFNASGAFDDDD